MEIDEYKVGADFCSSFDFVTCLAFFFLILE